MNKTHPLEARRNNEIQTLRRKLADTGLISRPIANDLDDLELIRISTTVIVSALPRRMSLNTAAQLLDLTTDRLMGAFIRMGLHPRDHIRRHRLKGVREHLASPVCQGSVDEVLQDWGFPPRSTTVIADYNRAFGETPEETRNRFGVQSRIGTGP